MKMYLNVSGGVLRSVVEVLVLEKKKELKLIMKATTKINGRKNKDKLGNK